MMDASLSYDLSRMFPEGRQYQPSAQRNFRSS